jgi:regulatory protein
LNYFKGFGDFMKKITKIEYQKKNKDRVNVYLDDKYEFGLDLNTLIKYSLRKDMELEEEFIDEILIAEEKNKAYNYAVSQLAGSSKSEKELRNKMSGKGYDLNFIEDAIDRLKSNKYIDDEEYCDRFIHDKTKISKYGKLKVKSDLYAKGIDRETIEEKINQISDEDEMQRAIEAAQKKLRTLEGTDPLKIKFKLYNYLAARGFEHETVKKAISELLNSEI